MAQDTVFNNIVAGYGQTGAYDDAGGHYDFSLVHTDVVLYMDCLAASNLSLLPALTAWTDATLSIFVAQPDVPRNLQARCVSAGGINPMTGTITINGYDADGAVIQEVITVNVAGGAVTTYYTNRAFGYVTSVVVDQTDAKAGSTFSMGISDKFGLPNYPFGATTDVFKVKKNNAAVAYAGIGGQVDITYGTYNNPTPAIVGDDMTFWVRNSRLT
jgi:hypothetical protein